MVLNDKNRLVEIKCNFEFESCLDVYEFGLRSNGMYKVTNKNNQLVDRQCTLELKSCLDVYNLGYRESGHKHMIRKDDGQFQKKICYFNIKDCRKWKENGNKKDGKYLIHLPASGVKLVRCDMNTEEGGWIVMQRRFDGSVNFSRTWDEYRDGFGTLDGEFWLGNKYLHELTGNTPHKWFFKATTFDGDVGTSSYTIFQVQNEADNFKMTAHFNAGNSSLKDGLNFTSHDRLGSCSNKRGGFWQTSCESFHFYPNGEYKNQASVPPKTGIYWQKFKGDSTSMKETLMLIKEY